MNIYIDTVGRANLHTLKEALLDMNPSKLEGFLEDTGWGARIERKDAAPPERTKKSSVQRISLEQVVDDVLEETGLSARWDVRGKAYGEETRAIAIAQKLIKKGWNGEEIAETTGLDAADVNALFAEAGSQAQG